ncbi:MAG: DegT/DnrJ/EryC1/StrS family aminotransferase, partial [Dehalococcoidia bacterium]
SSNYRMSEITAVIGHDQCQRLDEFIEDRQRVAQEYTRQLEGGLDLVLPPGRCSWYKYIALLPRGVSQETVRTELKARGVSLAGGVYDIPVHQQPVFLARGGIPPLPLAEEYCPRHICLPIFYGITDLQVNHVVSSLREVLESLRPTAAPQA